MGLSCAGSLDVLIEPFDLTTPNNTLIDIYRRVRSGINQGKSAAIITRLKDSHQRLLVFEYGETSGTLGNTDHDNEAHKLTSDQMCKHKSSTISLGNPGVKVFL